MKNHWNLAIVLSLLFHTTIFVNPSRFFKKHPQKKTFSKKKIKEIEILPKKIGKIIKRRVEPLDSPAPLPYVENIMSSLTKNSRNFSLEKPQTVEKSSKKIIFSEIPKNIDKNLRKNPAYMNYYRLIRERIRTNAYRNYPGDTEGEVIIDFTISKNGSLLKANFESESESAVDLKNTALKSIESSTPFPVFPAKLSKYSQLRFNIPIYFKNN